jgi:hypothetical protein
MVRLQNIDGWAFVNICGQSKNCTLDDDAIQDPDIAGIGVGKFSYFHGQLLTRITGGLSIHSHSGDHYIHRLPSLLDEIVASKSIQRD